MSTISNTRVAIVAAKRTPIGSFLGSLSTIAAPKLAASVISSLLKETNLPLSSVDEVYMGNVLQAGVGQSPARQAAMIAGLPEDTIATTVNKVCASGLKAVMLAAQSILTGQSEIVVAGGMENMSLVPHYSYQRTPTKFGDQKLIDGLLHDGLTDAYSAKSMGVFADQCAVDYSISREQQDIFAVNSYQKAQKAWEEGKFSNEVVPISVPSRKGVTIVDTDEEYTRVSFDKIPKLSPAFGSEGTVTAANASTLNDGASALLLMSEEKLKALGVTPLAYIEGFSDAAKVPEQFTTAPAKALPLALKRAGYALDQIDLFEINEAFSVVGIANQKVLNIPSEKLNIYGGAVALGHPLGCSGARILTTLVHALINENKTYGAAAVCNGGGGASALIIKKAQE